MPPNKSRRLPGGKVRRPRGRVGQAAQPARVAEPEEPLDLEEVEESEGEELEAAVPLEEFRVARAAPEPVVTPSRRVRERRGRTAGVRAGPSPMDAAALNYRHIRGDLVRIALIAVFMFGVIVALSFVIR